MSCLTIPLLALKSQLIPTQASIIGLFKSPVEFVGSWCVQVPITLVCSRIAGSWFSLFKSPAPNLAGLFKSSVLLITPNLTVQVLLPPWEAYNLSPFSFICFVFLLRWWLLRFLFGLLLLTIPPLKGMELVVLFRGLISFFHNEWLLVIDFVFSLARIFFCPLFKYSN